VVGSRGSWCCVFVFLVVGCVFLGVGVAVGLRVCHWSKMIQIKTLPKYRLQFCSFEITPPNIFIFFRYHNSSHVGFFFGDIESCHKNQKYQILIGNKSR
jgi:hypothetical protein